MPRRNNLSIAALSTLIALSIGCGSDSVKPKQPENIHHVKAEEGGLIETGDLSINIPKNTLERDSDVEIRTLEEEVIVASNLDNNSKTFYVDFNSSLNDSILIYLNNKRNKAQASFDSTDVVFSQNNGITSIRKFNVEDGRIKINYKFTGEERNQEDLEIKLWSAKPRVIEPTLYTRNVDPSSNEPVILLIHGLGSRPESFDRNTFSPDFTIFKQLNRDFNGRVITYHYPTNKLPSENAVSLYNLLRQWRLESPINIVGHSMGGIVAREFVRRYNEEFRIPHYVQLAAPNDGFVTSDSINWFLEFLVNNFEAHDIDIINPYTSEGPRALVQGSEYLESLNTRLDHRINTLNYCFYGLGNRWPLSPIIPEDDDGLINRYSADLSGLVFPKPAELYIGGSSIGLQVSHWDILPLLGVDGCPNGCALTVYLRENP